MAATGRSSKPPVLATFFSAESLTRCVPIALLVGTILSVVNQASVVADGDATWVTWVRVGVNYCMPFLVSSTGFLASERSAWRSRTPEASVGGGAE